MAYTHVRQVVQATVDGVDVTITIEANKYPQVNVVNSIPAVQQGCGQCDSEGDEFEVVNDPTLNTPGQLVAEIAQAALDYLDDTYGA